MPDFPEFVDTLKKLHLKKKGNRPKVSPQKFYPSQVELQTQELLREELGEYAYKLQNAAMVSGVQGVYNVPGAVPQGFDEKVQRVAEEVSLFNMKAFANFSELAVGERYFPGGSEQREVILNTWSENFVNLCKSTNEEMRKKVAGVVSDGVLGGRNIRDLTKDIQNTCKEFSRSKAELIATTEVGKLNTAIARNQSESAGIQYYEWSAAMDGRTRESHAVMDGKICKWGDDDHYYAWETDPNTGKRKLVRKPRPGNAYKGAPGTDFRCRCTALPYVPEYEDDYEAERPKGPQQGVTQELPEEKAPEPVQEKPASGKYSEFKFDTKFDSLKTSKEIMNYMAKKHGVKISSSFSTCNVEKLKKAFQGVDVVMGAFPEAKIGELVKKSDGRFIMAACWKGDRPFFIEMNNMYLRDDSKVRELQQNDFHPASFGTRQSGAHEMGHIVNFWLAKKEKGRLGYGSSNVESIAREITKKAANKVAGHEVTDYSELLKMRKAISGYADMSYDYMETVAESFGDVVENRDKANPLSKEIYRLVRERYNTAFGASVGA